MNDIADPRSGLVSSVQIDARNLVFASVQLLAAESLEQRALEDLGVDSAVGSALSVARERFLHALPDIKEMRNALTHFDEWVIARGRGPQKAALSAGSEPRDVSAHFWAFGFYSEEEEVRLGPFRIRASEALTAARDLEWAIGAAAQKVDRQTGTNRSDT